MDNKDKIIKEMAKVIETANENCIIYKDGSRPWKEHIARVLFNQGYRKLPEDSVVLSREEYEKYKSAVWLTPEEYQRYNRFLVEWNIGKIKRVNQDNSKNEIVHFARRKNEANGYDIENDKLIYFSNLLDGYKHEFKDLQEICDEMNGLHKRFDSYEEQLAFWRDEAQTYKLWKDNLVEELKQASKETAEKFARNIFNHITTPEVWEKLRQLWLSKGGNFVANKHIYDLLIEPVAKQFGVEIKE